MQWLPALALPFSLLAVAPARALPSSPPAASTAALSPSALQAASAAATIGGASDADAPIAIAIAARAAAEIKSVATHPSAKAPIPDEPSAKAAAAPPGTVAIPDAADDSESDEDVPEDAPAPAAANGEAEESEDSADTLPAPAAANGRYYTGDISDAELLKIWKTNRKELGTISVGMTNGGRLINAEPFPTTGGPWVVIDPRNSYATHETIDFLITAFKAVEKQFPGGPPARVNHISGKDGGYIRPHVSHQAGRDADIGLYYKEMPGPRVRNRVRYMDLARNWAFIRDLITMSDVQMILVDRRIQRVLYDYALSIGEDRGWLDSLFHAGAASLLKHAPHHRDHFHVRFYDAFAQELGRRVQPLLALDKDAHSVLMHRVHRGETLGRIAQHYGVSARMLRQANRLHGSMIRAGHMLAIPVRGACVRCPIPPPFIVPPRRLPPVKAGPPQLSQAESTGDQVAS